MPGADEITRVRYFERQFLGALDFQAEQLYDRDARRRHVLAHHTWGIVVGLELQETPVASDPSFVDVILRPGAAVDGFGRELVAYHPVRLDAASFDAFNTDAHQTVWLAYDEQEAGGARSGFADCQDATATRIAESWRLVVSPSTTEPDAIIVDGVAATPPGAGTPPVPADLSVPYQQLPEQSPGDRWLIRLGTVHWDGTQQRFRPAAAGRLNEGRAYVGAIADHLLSPTPTLHVRRRAPTTVDDDDFTTVEGRLRVQGRINAEKEIYVEGDRVRFTYDMGDEESTLLTAGRERPADGSAGHRLRVRLGEPGQATTLLSIGAGEGAKATDVLNVRADDVAEMATGTLRFGSTIRQMIDLYTEQYGLGVQNSSMYFRSDSEFAWFKGGKHAPNKSDPGAGGQLQMRLDSSGSLFFGSRVRQMLNLWSTNYGLGVQSWTLYFRSDADFQWYRGGSHGDSRSDTGGGARAMSLDDASHLRVSGPITVGAGGDAALTTRFVTGKASGSDGLDNLHLNWATGRDVYVGQWNGVTSDLYVSGALHVEGAVKSVITAVRHDRAVSNAGNNAAAEWDETFGGELDEIYEAFVTLNGFSLWANDVSFNNFDRLESAGNIVQHVYARVVSVVGTTVHLRAFCSESDGSVEGDNTMLVTVVAIGRKR
ncbi:hypothetical protein [Solirubrobacter soli]|uniref:hypothetical protein n=1 Tax=Solirubrobacter soli TaxID=363832 RepID=UPI000423E62B|nr:hypothetical protein [Solirubrobacter soli]